MSETEAEKVMPWSVKKTGPTVVTIRCEMERNKSWEQWLLATSDRHLDNPLSNLAMQRRHLDQAKARNAIVCDFGDLFCAMQGKGDMRSQKSSLRPEHAVDGYLNEIVKTSAKFFEPYMDQIAVIGTGNHESSVLKRAEFDLTSALVEKLQDKGSQVVRGGYRGWIRLMFQGRGGSGKKTIAIGYTHGSGGTTTTTKTNKRSTMYPDADIFFSGHVHDRNANDIGRIRLDAQGKEYLDDQVHLTIPTYKDEITDQGEGWPIEREHKAKPLGAWWIRFFWDSAGQRVRFEYTRAA